MVARSKRQRRFTVRFELGIGGLFGLTVVCLCIFLWLFLLGVWAGQTVLSPSSSAGAPWLHRFTSGLLPSADEAGKGGHEEPEPPEMTPEVAASPANATDAVKEETGASGTSCFSLQVGAFRETANAKEAVAEWQGKGYEAFSLPPREGSSLTRVFVGRFDDLAAANKLVADLEEQEKLRAYITLIPVADK